MAVVYISIGSNIDPERNVPAAVLLLREWVRVTAVSTFYLTMPLESPDSPPFYNGVVRVETDIGVRELKRDVLRGIEERLGRQRSRDRCAPRVIDLDLSLYGNEVVREPDLVVPDPEIVRRAFIAVPLLEMEPDLVLPDSGVRLSEAASALRVDDMVPLIEFTRALRREVENEP